jgi:hypothetical protein
VVLYELLTGELPVGKFEPPSRKVQIDVRLDAIVLRALEHTPELRYQTISEMRSQMMTVVNDPGPARAATSVDPAAPRPINVATSFISTPEQLATFDGQMFLLFRKAQMVLDDHHLSFARAGTTTVIPLAAIVDLSIGTYPRVMSPAGLDFISVTYKERGQTQRLFFSPFEGWFGPAFRFNRYIADWFNSIRAAIVAATGYAPGNTPAHQLGTPPSSRAVILVLLLPLIASLLLLAGPLFLLRQKVPPVLAPTSPIMRPDMAPPPVAPSPQIRDKPPDSGFNE